MTETFQLDSPLPEQRDQWVPPRWPLRSLLFALVFALGVAAIAGTAVALAWSQPSPAPADDSADAGFARDMADHHAQAVEMSLIVLALAVAPTDPGRVLVVDDGGAVYRSDDGGASWAAAR